MVWLWQPSWVCRPSRRRWAGYSSTPCPWGTPKVLTRIIIKINPINTILDCHWIIELHRILPSGAGDGGWGSGSGSTSGSGSINSLSLWSSVASVRSPAFDSPSVVKPSSVFSSSVPSPSSPSPFIYFMDRREKYIFLTDV